MDKNRRYILASGSPRRIEMMRRHGIEPLIMPASIEENIPPKHDTCETVMFLALKKAKAAEREYLSAQKALSPIDDSQPSNGSALSNGSELPGDTDQPAIILAADTIVYKDEIMGKPQNREDAFRMLSSLRNDFHYVVTGCALVEAASENARVFAEATKAYVKDFADEELNAYLDTDEPYDKAGAYAIQGAFGAYIDHIEGDYDNVVGFPWKRIEKELDFLRKNI